MPELSRDPLRGFVEKVKTSADDDRYRVGRWAQDFNLKYHGQGAECVVVSIPGEDEKVFGITFKGLSGLKARQIFYSQRILSTLFPHNFPRFYAVSGSKPGFSTGDSAGTVRQMVEGLRRGIDYTPIDSDSTFWERIVGLLYIGRGKSRKIRYPFSKVENVLKEHMMFMVLDTFPTNFLLALNGGEFYLDTPLPHAPSLWEDQKLMKYMKMHRYSSADQKTVSTAIARLRALETEEEVERRTKTK